MPVPGNPRRCGNFHLSENKEKEIEPITRNSFFFVSVVYSTGVLKLYCAQILDIIHKSL